MDIIGGSKSTTSDLTPGKFQALRGPLANVFASLLGQQDPLKGGKIVPQADPLAGVPQADPSLLAPAPIRPEEQALLDALLTEGQGRQALLGQTTAGQFLTPDTNPFLSAFIQEAQRATAQNYEEVLGRTLPGQFTRAGHSVQPGGSSPFDRAAAIQSRGLADALASIGTNIGFGAYEAERGRQQEAIQLGQQEVQTTIANLQNQALPRFIEQFGIDQGLKEFQRMNDELLAILSIVSGVSAPTPAAETRTTPGILPTISGIATGGALAAGNLGANPFGGNSSQQFGLGFQTPGGQFIPQVR